MVASELGDGLVHAFIQQVLVAKQAVLDVVRPVEFQGLAVGPVVLEHTVRADVVQQPANHHKVLIQQSRRDFAAGDAVRGGGLRRVGATGRVRR